MRQSLNLIACFPVLIADAFSCKRHYFDGGSLVLHNPQPDLLVAENFLYMIRPDNKYTPLESEILDLSLLLQAEHGGGNAKMLSQRHRGRFSMLQNNTRNRPLCYFVA